MSPEPAPGRRRRRHGVGGPARTGQEELLLGEWACLGILDQAPSHGFAVAGRLKPDGDIGRVWSVSRPLTYRSLEQLARRGFVHAVGQEPGIAGGARTILAPTALGRSRLRAWLLTPVPHLRDVRSALLLKLVLAAQAGIDVTAMLAAQRALFQEVHAALAQRAGGTGDVVDRWRLVSAEAALRFVDDVTALGSTS